MTKVIDLTRRVSGSQIPQDAFPVALRNQGAEQYLTRTEMCFPREGTMKKT